MRPDALLTSLAGLASACCLSLASPAVAAEPALWVDTRTAYACLPTAQGTLAGTDGGLLELGPGATTPKRTWTQLDGLPGLHVYALAETAQGLWAGTEGGVARLVPGSSGLELAQVMGGAAVRAIVPYSEGLALATWGAGILRVANGGAPTPWALAGARVSALAAHEGVLFAAVPDLGVYHVASARASLVPGSEGLHATALASHGGELWLGTPGGLFALRQGRLREVASAPVRALAPSRDGLLVGTTLGGVALRGAGGALHPVGPSLDARVEGLGLRGGHLACVATPAGLHVEDAGAWRAVEHAGPPSNDLSAVAEDRAGRLWLGTFDRGLAVLEERRWRPVPEIPRYVNDLALDAGRDAVWVATARGLFQVAAGQGSTRSVRKQGPLPSDDVHAVTVAPDGRVIVGTSKGAAVLEGHAWRAIDAKGKTRRGAAWTVAVGPDGAVWVGTSRGLLRWRDGGPPTRFSMASGHLPDDWVTALAWEGADLWVGTYAHGVARLRGGSGAKPSSKSLGGRYVNLGGLTVGGGSLHVATMQGLLARSSAAGALEPTSVLDGLDVTRVAHGPSGRWAATRKGLYLFPSGTPDREVRVAPR